MRPRSELLVFHYQPILTNILAVCGGGTVFNALHSFGTKSSDVVGVIGIGGLGHLEIQFAAKLGCKVVVFSSTDSKKEEAIKLGATEFVATKDVKRAQGVQSHRLPARHHLFPARLEAVPPVHILSSFSSYPRLSRELWEHDR